MKVLLTGAAGQLGQALLAASPADVELIATSRAGGAGMVALDLADAGACRAAVLEHRPHWGSTPARLKRSHRHWPKPAARLFAARLHDRPPRPGADASALAHHPG